MPAGVRVLEASLLRRFKADDIVCCYPDDLEVGSRRTGILDMDTYTAYVLGNNRFV